MPSLLGSSVGAEHGIDAVNMTQAAGIVQGRATQVILSSAAAHFQYLVPMNK